MRNIQTRNPIAGIAIETFVQVPEPGTDPYASPLKWTTRLIVPDAESDIVSFNTSLSLDSVGSFSVTLDNKGQKFFRSDELETLSNGVTALEDFCLKETAADVKGAPVEARSLYTRFGGDWTRGDCHFRPMMIVKLFARNHFLFSDSPNITNIFTGVLSSVTDRFNAGVYEVTLQGESILKWLQLSNVLVNPALAAMQDQAEGISAGMPQGYFGRRDLFTTRFAGRPPQEIIEELIRGREVTQDDGTVVRVAGVATYALEATDVTDEEALLARMSQYRRIFERRDHGALRELFDDHKLHIHPTMTELDSIARVVAYARFLRRALPDITGAEFQTRFSVCQDVARAVYWEFYTDGEGDIWFHPPLLDIQRFLLNTHPEVYVLDDDSRISWDVTHSDRSIKTRTEVTPQIDMVQFNQTIEGLSFTNFYEDRARIPIYGRRTEQIKTPLVTNVEDAKLFAELVQTRNNVREEKTGQISMPLRAEIRLARPFYMPQRNLMFNIHSVSHNYGVGRTAQTSIGLNFGRKPWEALEEILGFETPTDEEITLQKLNQAKTVRDKSPSATGN